MTEFNDYIIDDFYVHDIVVGAMYHLNWAKSVGMVWRCYDKNTHGIAFLRTPKSNRELSAQITVLRATNRQASINKSLRLKKEKRKMELEKQKPVTTKEILEHVSASPSGPAPLPGEETETAPVEVRKSRKRMWKKSEELRLREEIEKYPNLNAYAIGDLLEEQGLFEDMASRQIWGKIYHMREADKKLAKESVIFEYSLGEKEDSTQEKDLDVIMDASKENIVDEENLPETEDSKETPQPNVTKFLHEESLKKFSSLLKNGIWPTQRGPEEGDVLDYKQAFPGSMLEFKDKPNQQTFVDGYLVVTNGKINLNNFLGEITASFVIKGNFVIERID